MENNTCRWSDGDCGATATVGGATEIVCGATTMVGGAREIVGGATEIVGGATEIVGTLLDMTDVFSLILSSMYNLSSSEMRGCLHGFS